MTLGLTVPQDSQTEPATSACGSDTLSVYRHASFGWWILVRLGDLPLPGAITTASPVPSRLTREGSMIGSSPRLRDEGPGVP
jgi:hypothetical protein